LPTTRTTTVQGISVQVDGSTQVVVGGTSYSIGSGAPEQTIVVQGQTISVGSQGLVFSGTTIAPPPAADVAASSLPSNLVIIDGQLFSAVGSSIVVIGGTTFSYGPGTATQTDVFNGETITIGPSGVSFDGTTIGGTVHPSGTQYAIAGGLSITELGSTLAVISGTTFTVGPGATPITTVINGETVTIGPTGVAVGGATLTYPLVVPTQTLTAEGITFSEIGSSLAVIGGKTFTFGPGATPTTDVYNGQTISIGPGGLGFATTTFTGVFTTSTSSTDSAESPSVATHTSKKNGVGRLRPGFGLLGTCVVICIGYFI